MALTPGSRLGPYEIIAQIGAGGMGEVYRARDTRLDRDVAIKVLPEAFTHDADRLARFQREARTLASLNHPHIAAIYGLEESLPAASGQAVVTGLVMELVEGEDLSQVIGRGPIAMAEALPIAKQIAEALEAAHEQNIIHRDLKPANVKVRPDGTVKVLDFGLARTLDPGPGTSDPSASPTLTARATQMGMIIGTAAYMAPEQARGKAVDKRADIWAFGAVFYEMLSGRRAFDGDDVSSTLASVLKEDVRWDALPKEQPPPLRRLLRRCLDRDPRKRLQDIGEARIALDDVLTGSPAPDASPAATAAPARPRAWMGATAVLGAMVLVSATVAVMHLREARPVPATVAFDISPSEAVGELRGAPVVSPDGRYVALTGTKGLSVRAIASTQVVKIDVTELAASPFWSPDSRTIAYLQNAIGANSVLKRLSISGGAPDAGIHLPWSSYAGTWGTDGTIIVVGQGMLQRIPSGGGAPTPLGPFDATRRETYQASPGFLPDGRHVLYVSFANDPNNGTVRVRALDTNQTTDLLTGVRDAKYAQAADGSGRLLFVRAAEMWSQPFDAPSLTLSGEPVRIAVGVESLTLQPGAAFSASRNGVLAYRVIAPPELSELVWYDRAGKSLGTVGDPAIYSNPSLSPDDRWLAVSKVDGRIGTRDVWVIDLVRKASSRLTLGDADDLNPVWSPDGREVAYSSGTGSRDIFRKLASGVGEPKLVLKSTAQSNLEDWSSDGRNLLYNVASSAIWRLTPSDGDKPVALSKGTVRQDQAQLSPDGRWLAYREYGTEGASDVFIQTFPPGEDRWQISTAGGQQPRWRRDGRELFYVAGDQLMAVPITVRGSAIEAGVPRPLFRMVVERATRRNYYVASADGQRFLVVQALPNATPPRLTTIVNWTDAGNR